MEEQKGQGLNLKSYKYKCILASVESQQATSFDMFTLLDDKITVLKTFPCVKVSDLSIQKSFFFTMQYEW